MTTTSGSASRRFSFSTGLFGTGLLSTGLFATLIFLPLVAVAQIEEIPEGGTGSAAGPSANALEGGQRHGVLRLRRFAKRADIDYIFEVSDDLVHWRSGEDEFFIAVDNQVSLVAYDLQPVSLAQGQRYYRLAIQFKNF